MSFSPQNISLKLRIQKSDTLGITLLEFPRVLLRNCQLFSTNV